MHKTPGRSLLGRFVQPWTGWGFWPWLRYTLSWKGRRATLRDNPPLKAGEREWKLHSCADGHQCRAQIGGGCARGYCAHHEVAPDEAGVPRFPRRQRPHINQKKGN